MEKTKKRMDYCASKRAKHLQRAKYHAAFGNAAAANAHFQRAEQLLFGVAGQSASERMRARTERARQFPNAQATNELYWHYDFERMASGMLDAVLPTHSEVSMFVCRHYDTAKNQLAVALRRALGAWQLTPTFSMVGNDQFEVFTIGKETPQAVQLSVLPGPSGYDLFIDIAPAYIKARLAKKRMHVRDDEHDEHDPGARMRYNKDAMEN